MCFLSGFPLVALAGTTTGASQDTRVPWQGPAGMNPPETLLPAGSRAGNGLGQGDRDDHLGEAPSCSEGSSGKGAPAYSASSSRATMHGAVAARAQNRGGDSPLAERALVLRLHPGASFPTSWGAAPSSGVFCQDGSVLHLQCPDQQPPTPFGC